MFRLDRGVRFIRHGAAAIVAGALVLGPQGIRAAEVQAGARVDADFAVRAARAAFVYKAQATQNAALKAMDDDLLDQRRRADTLGGQLESVRGELQRAQKDATGSRARITQLQLQLAQIGRDAAAAQDRFASTLASRDADYARALETLRSAADDILATPDGLRVLELNSAGDWEGVKAIEAALRAARQKSRDMAEAADARAFAVLALDNAAKGRETHAAVIARFEEVTRLDPSNYADWSTLATLYLQANQLTDARRAAATAAQTAKSDIERIDAARTLGAVAASGGDGSGALDHYRAAATAARRLAAADPASLMAKRVLLDALIDLAATLEQLHRREEALAASREAETISVALLRSGAATSYDLRAFLRLSFDLAQQLLAVNRADAALDLAAKAAVLGTALATQHADDVGLQFDLAALLTQVGDISAARNNAGAAAVAYQHALDIDRAALARDPGFADGRARLVADIDRLAQVRAAAGDLPAALALLRENLGVARELAAAEPSAVANRISVALTQGHIAEILLAQHDLAGAAEAARDAGAILGAAAPAGSGPDIVRAAISANLRQSASIAAARGEPASALRQQRQATTVSAALLHDDPASEIAIHEALANQYALALLGAPDASWAALVARLETFQKDGRLAPADAWMLADARNRISKDHP